MPYPTLARSATLSLPGLTADYVRLLPGKGPSITAGHAIGVAFTPQRRATWWVGGARRRTGRLAPATVFLAPAGGLEWVDWSDVSESIEIWLDPSLLSELSQLGGGPSRVTFDYREERSDGVVLNIAALVRRRLVSGPDGMRGLDSLPLLLATHVLEQYQGLRLPRQGRIRRLDRRELLRMTEYVEAHLQDRLTVLDLARVAQMSPYHFAKSFKATTGSGPHGYVAARRMERALVLLQQTRLPVRRIARLVGFDSLTHFRLSFRQAWGEPTHWYRKAGRPRKMVTGTGPVSPSGIPSSSGLYWHGSVSR